MRTVRSLVLPLAVPLVFGACAPGINGSAGGPAPRDVITVEVTNHNWSEMVVYALLDGFRLRLGMVSTHNTAVFKISRGKIAGTSDIRILLDPIGSAQTHTTGRIQVWQGGRIEVSVENHLPLTSFAVWRH